MMVFLFNGFQIYLVPIKWFSPHLVFLLLCFPFYGCPLSWFSSLLAFPFLVCPNFLNFLFIEIHPIKQLHLITHQNISKTWIQGWIDLYQTRCSRGCSTNTSVTHSLIETLMICENIFKTPSLPNRKKVHLPPPVTCQVSCVMCNFFCGGLKLWG